VNKEETRTKIMYKAMLNNVQCKLSLDSLIKSGLVHEVNNGDKTLYRVTPKGAGSWHTTTRCRSSCLSALKKI